ncbi:hypothetical protein [Burkholderia sp. Ac-20365]|uniref:hypothetical protein n=1 Tax=Burkholderia sp. Ac-20365 TaxID=2703897 RepID=UPI00197C1071|nr:hypothetical protein [Burkholderia sp. Ac-20365]MBN3761032.1 hypothetical protein [Burkholderia sp. Ac-20365]
MTQIVFADAGNRINREMEAANRARRRRETLGLSRKFVADNSTISLASLSRWEKIGVPVHLSRSDTSSWERVLNVPGGWLFGKTEREPKPPAGKAEATDRLRAAGARARARREELNLSRTKLALAIAVRDSRLRQWEIDGIPHSVSEGTIAAWEAALQVAPGWLLGRSGGTASPTRKPAAERVLSSGNTAAKAITEASSLLACGTATTSARNAALLAKRYGVNAPHGTGLAVIARDFGITESRACQLVGDMLQIASESGLPASVVAVFDVIEATAKQHLPCSPSQMERVLRPLLGDSLSIADASRFAREILGKPLLTLESYLNDLGSTESVDDQRTVVVRNMARAMIRAVGAAHLGVLIGQAIQLGWDLDAVRSIRDHLQAIQGFEWLEQRGRDNPEWFWFGETADDNPVIVAIRRVCSVADAALTTDVAMGAIERVRALRIGRDERSSSAPYPTPPWLVTAEILNRTSFLGFMKGRYRATVQLDPSRELTGKEYDLYQELLRHGFVVSKQTLTASLLDAGKMDLSTLQNLLSRSPIIMSQSVGVYVLRGVKPRAEALALAYRGDVDD